jgi:cytochrome c
MGPKAYAAVVFLALSAAAANAQTPDPTMGGPGDAVHGKALFAQHCAVCHQPDKGGQNGVGPALYGAYGRAAAKASGFTYSDALKASGVVWTPDKLNLWVQKPAVLIPGVRMALAPVTLPQDRSDIIAYLKTESTVKDAPAKPATAAKPATKKHKKSA